jgi:hypothetical protein|tara:strand:- start:1203 stop:2126 length:924 start_codon:yes stop_codon:yes gene_type:complete
MSSIGLDSASTETIKEPTSVRGIANILGTPSEPEQPTDEKKVEDPGGEAKTPEVKPEGDKEQTPQRFTTKLGDQDIEFDLVTEGVDPKLIKSGLMFEADYRKKTAEVAETRRANESKHEELITALDNAKLMLEIDLDSIDPEKSETAKQLKEDDFEEWFRQFEAVNNRVKQYNQVKAKVDSDADEKSLQNRADQKVRLKESIPEWLDSEVMESESVLMVKTMNDLGFSNEDINKVGDHKIFLLARKAALFDQIMAKDLKAKLDEDAGKTLLPGNANEEQTKDKITAARERLKKGGKVKDLAAVFSES